MYLGFISATNSEIVESVSDKSGIPRGISVVGTPFRIPLGHSLV